MTKRKKNDVVRFDDGRWYGSTLGHFIGLLVDNVDPAVLFRVVEDGEKSDDHCFTRRMEIVLIPNGLVNRTIAEYPVEEIHKTLFALMEKGLIK